MNQPSSLVADGLAAATAALNSEIELLATPVESLRRAVIIAQPLVDNPDRIAIKVDTDHSRAASERSALRAFSGRLTVPSVLFTDDQGVASITGMSFLAGDPLDRVRPGATTWIQAGAALRSIHDPDATAADWRRHDSHAEKAIPWRDDLVAQALDREIIDATTAVRFTTVTDIRHPVEAGSAVIHGDASPQHFLQQNQDLVGVIDFGDVGIGDPAYDLATLTVWEESLLDDVLAGYGGDEQTSAALRERVAFYRPLRQLAAAIWSHDHDFIPTAYVVALYQELLKPVM